MATNKRPLGRLRWVWDCATLPISTIRQFLAKREEGASLTEYALLLGLIALVCIAGMAALSGYLSTIFTNLASNFGGSGG